MPLAFIPSPARASWHAGVLAFRVQALCVVLAILLAIFWTDRRYRRAGGPRGVITDVAAWAVPAGLLPAVIGLLLAGPQPPVLAAIRAWDEAVGFPGAVACGLAGAWIGCHRMRVRFPAARRGRAAARPPGPGP
ncbi:MAG TPA: prolipoprotein diacylglyceryl transferase family protein, partial [Trebonia sp.]|nr:prolipoprotein diacylglyceryl transferase family protein [Trebonia sp.]